MAASMARRVRQAARSWRRMARIERASGLRESAIHALMMTEVSVPLLLTLLYAEELWRCVRARKL